MPEYQNKGDALRGDKIVASARNIGTARIAARTSAHKGQFVDLKDNAYCIIDVPFKYVLDKKKK